MKKRYITEQEKKRLLKVMIDHGIYSKAQLARILGVSRPYISHLLSGRYPYYQLRQKIEAYFGVKIFNDQTKAA